MSTLRAALVLEQTLGHVTHSQNLGTAVSRQTSIAATWIRVPFGVSGLERLVPAFRGNWSVRASYRARRELGRALATRRHDVLFFHTQVTALFSVGLMRRVPSVISLDATPLNYDSVGAAYGHRAAGSGWLDERKHVMNRAAFHAASALVTWSEWARDSLVADYGVDPERVRVIAPGAASAYFSIGERRSALPSHGDPVRFLFVGGDFVRKGGSLLLDAVRAARTRRPFELHVVTQGRIGSQPGVTVHNGVGPNSPELLRLFRDADAFVLPSRGECLSVVLMEAGAAGLPVISTGVGALREAARDRENALVVAADDGAALRAAIERLADDEDLRRRMGRAGHQLARSKFDADRNNDVLLGLLASVARPVGVRSAA
ncbi:MAG: glycosyltransferase family 4 protein [Candidatus Limnocylindria bacterium]